MNVLHVLANPKPQSESHSRHLAEVFLASLLSEAPHTTVTEVDLYHNPPPFYDYDTYRYFWCPVFDAAYRASDQERAAAQYSLSQCELFKQADVLVLTVPMWHFGLPAILKAWMDQVLTPNVTFVIGDSGVKALHRIRRVVVLSSSGGVYGVGELRDGLRNGITAALGFAGITQIDFVWAQGQNPFFFKDSGERMEQALNQAAFLGKDVAKLSRLIDNAITASPGK